MNYFIERIQKAMKYPNFNQDDIISFHNIRDVSPGSHMYSTTFRLPEQVAFSDQEVDIMIAQNDEEEKEEAKEESKEEAK